MAPHRAALALVPFLVVMAGPCAALPDRPVHHFSDFAGVVDEATESRLNARLSALERETSVEVAVVTVGSLEGMSVEDYARKLFNSWGVGKRGRDNGIMLLIAPAERKARIEVGYGLEHALTDGRANEILHDAVVPAMKRADPAAACETAVNRLEAVARSPEARSERPAWFWLSGAIGTAGDIAGAIRVLASEHPFLSLILAAAFAWPARARFRALRRRMPKPGRPRPTVTQACWEALGVGLLSEVGAVFFLFIAHLAWEGLRSFTLPQVVALVVVVSGTAGALGVAATALLLVGYLIDRLERLTGIKFSGGGGSSSRSSSSGGGFGSGGGGSFGGFGGGSSGGGGASASW